MSNKIGRQTPTNSYIIPYKSMLGNEAIELYHTQCYGMAGDTDNGYNGCR